MSWAPDGSKILIDGQRYRAPQGAAGHHQPGRDRVHGARCQRTHPWVWSLLARRHPDRARRIHRARAESLLPSGARDLHGASLRWWRPRPAHAPERNEPELFARRHAGRVPRGPGTARRVSSPLSPRRRHVHVPTGHLSHRRTRWLRLRGERRRHRPASDRVHMASMRLPPELVSRRTVDPVLGLGRRSTSFTPTAPGFGGSRWRRFRDCVRRTTRHGLPTARASCSSDVGLRSGTTSSRRGQMARDVEQITHTHGIAYRSPDWGTNAG